MCRSAGWVRRSRIWRLAFLADEAGYWDSTQGLATALFATKRKPETIATETLHPLIPWVTVGAPIKPAAAAGDAAGGKGKQTPGAATDVERGAGAASAADDALPSDCPLTLGDPDALRWSVPTQLQEASFQSGGYLDSLRVWCTCLSVCSLMDQNEAFLLDDDFTLADRGFQWLEEQAMLHPQFGLILGETLAKARETVKAWERYHVRCHRVCSPFGLSLAAPALLCCFVVAGGVGALPSARPPQLATYCPVSSPRCHAAVLAPQVRKGGGGGQPRAQREGARAPRRPLRRQGARPRRAGDCPGLLQHGRRRPAAVAAHLRARLHHLSHVRRRAVVPLVARGAKRQKRHTQRASHGNAIVLVVGLSSLSFPHNSFVNHFSLDPSAEPMLHDAPRGARLPDGPLAPLPRLLRRLLRPAGAVRKRRGPHQYHRGAVGPRQALRRVPGQQPPARPRCDGAACIPRACCSPYCADFARGRS